MSSNRTIGTPEQELKKGLALCSVSTKATCKMLMHEHFSADFSRYHDELTQVLDDPKIQKVNIIASRGFGKTSLVTKGFMGRNILFRKNHFSVYITKSFNNAVEQTENLKRELLNNRNIKKIFGSIKADDYESDMDESFSKSSWVANGSTLILPRGYKQQVRGLLFDRYRPDIVVCDDLEDDELIESAEYRRKVWEFFMGEVLYCTSRYDKNWKMIYIDTVKHEDCIPEKLAALPDWHTIRMPLCNDAHKSLVPEMISDEELDTMYKSHEVAGTLDTFCREIQCVPMSKANAAFKPEYYRYYQETDVEFISRLPYLDSLVIIDPAKTDSKTADDSAILGVSVDLARRAIYVRDVVAGRFPIDEVYDQAISMADRLGAKSIAIEVTGLGNFATYPFTNHFMQKGKHFNVVELHAKKGQTEKGKAARIRSLVALYRTGSVYHNPQCCAILETQLNSFPRARNWDVMDAFAYIVEALGDSNKFFFPEGVTEMMDDATLQAEYKELDYEDESMEKIEYAEALLDSCGIGNSLEEI